MSEKIKGLPPVLPNKPKVLILGSMPSVQSLETKQYYGNPRNHFWKILASLFQAELPSTYEEKIRLVVENEIGLWDSIGMCYREGSLDTNIKGEEPNDIPELLRSYPSIRLIACNGTKSYQVLNKYFNLEQLNDVDITKLPSSSPVPGRYNKTLEEKIEIWKQILKYVSNKE